LYCIEATADETAEPPDSLRDVHKPCLIVRTKNDLLEHTTQPASPAGSVSVSALTGAGLAELRGELVKSMFAALGSTARLEPVVTRARQRVALETAFAELGEFGSARATGIETAVAATHLRGAVCALEAVVGLVTPDEVLDRVFSRFCVGK